MSLKIVLVAIVAMVALQGTNASMSSIIQAAKDKLTEVLILGLKNAADEGHRVVDQIKNATSAYVDALDKKVYADVAKAQALGADVQSCLQNATSDKNRIYSAYVQGDEKCNDDGTKAIQPIVDDVMAIWAEINATVKAAKENATTCGYSILCQGKLGLELGKQESALVEKYFSTIKADEQKLAPIIAGIVQCESKNADDAKQAVNNAVRLVYECIDAKVKALNPEE